MARCDVRHPRPERPDRPPIVSCIGDRRAPLRRSAGRRQPGPADRDEPRPTLSNDGQPTRTTPTRGPALEQPAASGYRRPRSPETSRPAFARSPMANSRLPSGDPTSVRADARPVADRPSDQIGRGPARTVADHGHRRPRGCAHRPTAGRRSTQPPRRKIGRASNVWVFRIPGEAGHPRPVSTTTRSAGRHRRIHTIGPSGRTREVVSADLERGACLGPVPTALGDDRGRREDDPRAGTIGHVGRGIGDVIHLRRTSERRPVRVDDPGMAGRRDRPGGRQPLRPGDEQHMPPVRRDSQVRWLDRQMTSRSVRLLESRGSSTVSVTVLRDEVDDVEAHLPLRR